MSANVHQFRPHEKDWKPCNCTDSIQRTMHNVYDEATGGCENSAILHHGSYIRFGCLQFAFTIINYSNDNPSNINNDLQKEWEIQKPGKSFKDVKKSVKHKDENVCENVDSDMGNTEPSTASECDESNQASDTTMEIDP